MGAKIYPEGLLKTIPLNSPISEDRIVNKVFEISAKYGLQVKINKEEVKMEGSFFEPKESAVTIYNSKFNTKYKFFALVQRQKGTTTYLYVYMAGKSDNNRKVLMHDEQLKQGHFVGSLLFKPSGRAIEDEALYYNIMQNNVLPEAFNELMNERYNEPQYTPKTTIRNEPQFTPPQTNTNDPQPTPRQSVKTTPPPVQKAPQPTPQSFRNDPQNSTDGTGSNKSSFGTILFVIIVIIAIAVIFSEKETNNNTQNSSNSNNASNTSSISKSEEDNDEWYLQERNYKDLYYYVPFKEFVNASTDNSVRKSEGEYSNRYTYTHSSYKDTREYYSITIEISTLGQHSSYLEWQINYGNWESISKIENETINGHSWKKAKFTNSEYSKYGYSIMYEIEHNGIYYMISYDFYSNDTEKDNTNLLDSLKSTIRFSK